MIIFYNSQEVKQNYILMGSSPVVSEWNETYLVANSQNNV